MLKLNAKQLRTSEPSLEQIKSLKKNPLYIILDNVLDTYNIGSIFRLADAVAAEKVFLCGETLTPPNHRIKKASVNTWQWVNWEYCKTAVDAIRILKQVQDDKFRHAEFSSASVQVIAVEQDKRSVPYTEMKVNFPLAIVVGNETYGVSKEVLDLADEIVEIPMYGVNKSLNVMVSLGILLYKTTESML